MKQVQLPDGSIAQFPDAMPDSEIEAVLAKQFAPPGVEQKFEQALGQARQDVQAGNTDLLGGYGQGNTQAAFDIAKTMGSAMVAEPVAGLAGIGVTALEGPEAGSAVIKDIKDRFTVPLGEEGIEAMRSGVKAVPEPVINALLKFGRKYNDFADMAAQAFGPAAGAAVKTAPIAAAQLLGVKGATQVLRRSRAVPFMNKGSLARELNRPNVVPSVDELKAASTALFREIDNSGVVLNPQNTRILTARAKGALMAITGDKKRRAPGVWREVDDLLDAVKTQRGYPVDELVRMRNSLANIAGNKLDNQAVAAGAVRDALDEAIDTLSTSKLAGPQVADVGRKLKDARELWRRSMRAGRIEKAIEDAHQARSGFENGLRNEFGKLRRSKDFRFYTEAEKELIRAVERGGMTENTLRRLGRFGWGEGASSSLVGAGVGAGAGAYLFGPAGAVAVPLIGVVSRPLAARLQANNAAFALNMVKAGRDANRIVASYFAYTPAGKASPRELAQLLINPQVDLSRLKAGGQSIISQARLEAMAARARIVQGISAAAAGSGAASAQGQ